MANKFKVPEEVMDIYNEMASVVNKKNGNTMVYSAVRLSPTDFIDSRELKKEPNYISVEGSGVNTIMTMRDELIDKLAEHNEKCKANMFPIILKGITGYTVTPDVESIKEVTPKIHTIKENVQVFIKHEYDVESKVITLELYAKKLFINALIDNAKETGFNPKRHAIKIATAKAPLDCDNLEDYLDFKVTDILKINNVDYFQTQVDFEASKRHLILGESSALYALRTSKISEMRVRNIALDMPNVLIYSATKEEEEKYLQAFIKKLCTLFCFTSDTLNKLRYYQTVLNNEYKSEKKETPKHDKPIKSREAIQKDTSPTELILNLDTINARSAINKLFKTIDHKINGVRNYSVSEWQVMGYTRKLRNGKLQYFPPSIRHRRAVQLDNPIYRNKKYIVKESHEN